MSRPMALALVLLVLFLTSQSEWRASSSFAARGLPDKLAPALLTTQQRIDLHRDGVKEKIILDLMADVKHLEAENRRLEAEKLALQQHLQQLQLQLSSGEAVAEATAAAGVTSVAGVAPGAQFDEEHHPPAEASLGFAGSHEDAAASSSAAAGENSQAREGPTGTHASDSWPWSGVAADASMLAAASAASASRASAAELGPFLLHEGVGEDVPARADAGLTGLVASTVSAEEAAARRAATAVTLSTMHLQAPVEGLMQRGRSPSVGATASQAQGSEGVAADGKPATAGAAAEADGASRAELARETDKIFRGRTGSLGSRRKIGSLYLRAASLAGNSDRASGTASAAGSSDEVRQRESSNVASEQPQSLGSGPHAVPGARTLDGIPRPQAETSKQVQEVRALWRAKSRMASKGSHAASSQGARP